MQVILGVLFHFIGGFASGSFYIPFKKVKSWQWESYWIVGGLFSWLIVPPLAAYLTICPLYKPDAACRSPVACMITCCGVECIKK